MSKKQPDLLEARTYTPYSRWSFYRPHDRMATAWTNTDIHPITGEITKPPSRTRQEDKDKCDINNIIKSYKITGQITHIRANAERGAYMNLPDENDFQQSMNTIRQAEQAFATLPSKMRERFGNDPTRFLAFLDDPENREEAERLGIIPKKPAETPAPQGGGNLVPPPPAPPVSPPPSPEPPK